MSRCAPGRRTGRRQAECKFFGPVHPVPGEVCKGQDIYCAAAALRISTLPLFVVPPFRRLGQERRPAALRPSCPPAPGAWGRCPDAPPVTVRVGVRSDEIPKCARDRTSIVSTHDLRQLVGAPHPSNAKSKNSDPVAVTATPFWEFRPALVRDRFEWRLVKASITGGFYTGRR